MLGIFAGLTLGGAVALTAWIGWVGSSEAPPNHRGWFAVLFAVLVALFGLLWAVAALLLEAAWRST